MIFQAGSLLHIEKRRWIHGCYEIHDGTKDVCRFYVFDLRQAAGIIEFGYKNKSPRDLSAISGRVVDNPSNTINDIEQ